MSRVPAEMPVAMRRHIRGTLGSIPLVVGDATAQAAQWAGIQVLEQPGWKLLDIKRAERVAERCRRASYPDRSDPWPNGFRSALRRLAVQIETRLQGVRT